MEIGRICGSRNSPFAIYDWSESRDRAMSYIGPHLKAAQHKDAGPHAYEAGNPHWTSKNMVDIFIYDGPYEEGVRGTPIAMVAFAPYRPDGAVFYQGNKIVYTDVPSKDEIRALAKSKYGSLIADVISKARESDRGGDYSWDGVHTTTIAA